LDDAFKDRQEDIPMLFQKCRFYHCWSLLIDERKYKLDV
jgi:hypothetical protein